ncbi:MAG: hypothetical protein P8Z35_16315, partial [Ignavibacteriaceae bacterium]
MIFSKKIILILFLTISSVFAQQGDRVELGKLETGAIVSFVHSPGGEWGIEISGGMVPYITQKEPARVKISQEGKKIPELNAGYNTIQKTVSGIDANAELKYGKGVVFHVYDQWSLNNAVLSLRRKVEVAGNAPGGFNSSIVFKVDTSVSWDKLNCMVPGALYGDPTHDGERSPGGTLNYSAHRFIMREDMLPAPMFALSFENGTSVTMLDPTPDGESTVDETKLSDDVMTDSRFQFGSLGTWQDGNNPVEFGFIYPGSMSLYAYGPGASSKPRWIRRLHPITHGISHSYRVDFRFGKQESFRDVTRNSWRWAWNTLKPPVVPINIEQMRHILTDQLASQAATIDGRTGIPFAVATFDTNKPQWNWTMTGMGFVSKNVECADQLLREGERDTTERGKKMRNIGLSIISSMIQALHKIPLEATGYDLSTGKPWT